MKSVRILIGYSKLKPILVAVYQTKAKITNHKI